VKSAIGSAESQIRADQQSPSPGPYLGWSCCDRHRSPLSSSSVDPVVQTSTHIRDFGGFIQQFRPPALVTPPTG
jgi:hypothetical protein